VPHERDQGRSLGCRYACADWGRHCAVAARQAGGLDLDGFARLPILERGRVEPIDSLARNSLLMIRGGQSFQHLGRTVSADAWLLDVMFRPEPLPVVLAVGNRAAVEHDARDVQAGHRHHHPGDRLVAARDSHESVQEMAPDYQLDGVRNRLATHERGLHALGSHGDSVGDGDRVELDGRSAGGANPGFDLFREFPVIPVTRRDLDPAVRDANEGLFQVVVAEPDRP